jgi:DNA-damage-inducible protein D
MADEQNDRPDLRVAFFEGQPIRREWLDDRFYFSVIDMIGVLTQAAEPRTYWAQLKSKLAAEGADQTLQALKQLRMEAADGKQRLTDCADAQTMLRIVQSVPSPKAEPIKHWLATVGMERLEEMENPGLAIDRARQYYLSRGYSQEWIAQRLRSIVTRDDITDEWRERGAQEGREFALLTDTLHKGTFDITTAQHKDVKALKKRDNLRDSMSIVELALTSLAEATATELHRERDSLGFSQLQGDARRAGDIAGETRQKIEAELGRPVVTSENYKALTQPSIQQLPLMSEEGDSQE